MSINIRHRKAPRMKNHRKKGKMNEKIDSRKDDGEISKKKETNK